MKNKFSVLFLLLCTSVISFGQEVMQKHIVSKGETVTQIAKKYQLSANEIFLLNPEAVNGINENQILIIPNKNSEALQHQVLAKETIYGISKKYNIAIDQLYLFNPGLKENGLKIGQNINISKPKTTAVFNDNKNKKYKEIVVNEKETVYSLALQNNTSVNAIYQLNPDLETQGLKKEQLIKIPVSDSTVKPQVTAMREIIVQPKETIYGISKKYNVSQAELLDWNPDLKLGLKEGMKLKIQGENLNKLVENEVVIDDVFVSEGKVLETIKKQRNEIQELTLLLPFNINEDTFSDRTALNKRLNGDVFLNMSLDFYSGALIAMDSAKAMNLPIHIKIVDSKENNRTLNIEDLKNRIDFSSTDVVIGPFFQKNVDTFSEVFKNQDLMVVSPLSTDAGKPYPNQVHAMPNNRMVRNTMMEYLRSQSGNIIAVVNPKTNSSKVFFGNDFPEVKIVNTAENGALNTSSLEAQLIQGKINYVILDTNSMKTAIDLVSTLKKYKSKFDIRLVALDKLDALDSTEVIMQDLVDLRFTYPSITNDATTNVNKNFEDAFKKRFNITPNRFAVRGFDVTMDVILRMMQNDEDRSSNLFTYGSEQIENKFTYVNENGGIFNSGIYVLYYDKDLTIKEVQ